ncbi:hypothetical protein NS337_03545 [Pseudomonas oryzihabitans]|uniref:hypothetical protein n=1 Tax=Pseudomonas oryzihabitans TaxID=47885 RepID=UPI0007363C5A|nr:hypothetical protein [Pseudomonas psychrotolerans]KTT56419.1 hypothetical protein NS337_03545 [Pseudomonas psychrotolerans]
MMFTEAEMQEARRLAYDQGFNRGSGMDPKVQHTEAYIHFREQELAGPVKRERKAPAARRPIGDWLGDGEGRDQ